MALQTGGRLGGHQILGLLGAGGMGEVYRAHDTKLNRQVAIKVLPDPYASDPERVSRFHREAQAVAAFNHPNIAAIYELAESGGTKFLVLELVEGDTLADRLRLGPVPVDEALGIARQILDALETAHEKGICHRDLKPANVKLTPDGTVKVLDFGLAKFLQAAPAGVGNLTHSPTLTLAGTFAGVILGTAGYMSPEQAKGFEADQRSDIFSFGCILYELLTGRQAFEGDNASEILASVLKVPVDFAPLPPNLNPRLVEVLQRCLEKNPKKRWHAAADVRLEIESLAARALVADERPMNAPAPAAAPRPLWSRAIPVAATAVLSGAVVGYGAWMLKPDRTPAVTRFPLMLTEKRPFTNTGRRLIGISPDGSSIAFVATQRLYVRPMSGLESREVVGTSVAGGVVNPTFSPDGQSLVFGVAAERALKRVAIAGGAAVTLCQTVGPYDISWDESGIVWAEPGKGVMRVSPNGGTPEVLVAVGANETASAAHVLPGGKALLFSIKKATDGWDKGRVVVQLLRNGQPKTLVDGGADGRYIRTGHLVYAMSGVLLAVPFDVRTLTVTGGPVPVVEGVQRTGVGPTQTGLAQFDTSPTGTLAYVPGPVKASASEGDLDLALFDRHGGIQSLKLPPGTYHAPRVSPDGRQVAFERDDESGDPQIWLYDVAGTTAMRRLTFGGKNRAPVWSPDGQSIAFESDREGDLGLFRQRADGSGTPERLAKPEPGSAQIPQSWSRDGKYMLVTVQKEQQFTLSILTLSDGTLAPFGNVRSTQPTEASFSPDGRWVLYQASESAAGRQVFVQPFPATGAKYLVPVGPDSTSGGGHPFWNRNGREIVMNAAPTVSYAVAFTAAPQVAFGPPEEFSRAGRTEPNPAAFRRAVDPMPDGEHVIGVAIPGAAGANGVAQQIDVVLNWFEELKQKVPVK